MYLLCHIRNLYLDDYYNRLNRKSSLKLFTVIFIKKMKFGILFLEFVCYSRLYSLNKMEFYYLERPFLPVRKIDIEYI